MSDEPALRDTLRRLSERADHVNATASDLLDLAMFSLRIGDLPRARSSAVRALSMAVNREAPALVARSHLVRAECELREGGPGPAEVYLTKAFGSAVESGDPGLEILARTTAARIALAAGRAEEATDILRPVQDEDPEFLAASCQALAERFDFIPAERIFRRLRARTEPPEIRWRIHAAGLRLFRMAGRFDEAAQEFQRAREAIRELETAFPEGAQDPERQALLREGSLIPTAAEEVRVRLLLDLVSHTRRPLPLVALVGYVLRIAMRLAEAVSGLLRVGRPTLAAAKEGSGECPDAILREVEESGRERVDANGAVVCLPLVSAGRSFGLLYLEREPSADSTAFLRSMTQAIAETLDAAVQAEEARRDPLTRLPHHGEFERVLEEELGRVRRYGGSLSLLRMNLDLFSLVNGGHGAKAGDQVLRDTAARIQDTVDATPIRRIAAARYGGDGFEILLPGYTPEETAVAAETLLEAVRNSPFPGAISVTASLGGAAWPQDGRTATELYLAADGALYRAKTDGRNRYRAAGEEPSEEEEPDGLDTDTRSLLLSRPGRMVLSMVQRVMDESDDLDRALAAMLHMMCRAVGASAGTIALFDRNREVEFRATQGNAPSLSAIRKVIETDRPLRIERTLDDEWARAQQSISSLQITSLAVVPLRFRDRPAGVVYLDKRTGGRPFTDDDLTLLDQFARRVAAVLVRSAEAETNLRRVQKLEREVSTLRRRTSFHQIVGRSPSIQKVYALLEKVAAVDYPVVVEGETGTGKELVVRAVHFESARRERPFLPINCGSLTESVLESELFGHRKGAFTGAATDHVGLFEAAHGGTLFLDEIEAMSPSMQTKLLRVLEDKKIRPVGSTNEISVDVRIVAATNVGLKGLVAKGEFRQDLYYRLATFSVLLPPLRDRVDDLPLLVDHFLKEISEETHTPPKRPDEAVMRRLCAYGWPGNVRELKNVLRRFVLVGGEDVGDDDLPESLRPEEETPAVEGSYRRQIETAEKAILLRALSENGGNVRKTARALRMSRNTLLRKIDRYKLASEGDA